MQEAVSKDSPFAIDSWPDDELVFAAEAIAIFGHFAAAWRR